MDSCEEEKTPPEEVFSPPYSLTEEKEDVAIPEPPYSLPHSEGKYTLPENDWKSMTHVSKPKEEDQEKMVSRMRYTMVSLVMLTTGFFFLMFTLVLLLFSHEGMLTLQWNGYYWPLYLIAAGTLLYYGRKYLYRLPSS